MLLTRQCRNAKRLYPDGASDKMTEAAAAKGAILNFCRNSCTYISDTACGHYCWPLLSATIANLAGYDRQQNYHHYQEQPQQQQRNKGTNRALLTLHMSNISQRSS